PGTPTLSRVNSCDSIYFDAISNLSTPLHSPGLRPNDGINFLSMTPMMPMAPPSSSSFSAQINTSASHLSLRPPMRRSRSNSIPLIDLNNTNGQVPAPPSGQRYQNHGSNGGRTTPIRAPLLKHTKSSAHIPSFVITPSDDTPNKFPLTRNDNRNSVSGDPKNTRNGRFYRLILRPNSIFMRIAATQQGVRQKMAKVVKSCADKMKRTDVKTLLYWVMALIMLRGEVWQLIAASAVKVLTIVGEGDELLL
ncbi:hypothetical protein BGX31_001857, partial [Mortierella sp. GBA43]